MDNEMSEDTEFLLAYFEDLGGCKESQTLYPKKKSILHNMFGNTANSKEKYKESDEFYEDIYEYPIILLEIIQLLCCEKYNIDKNLKTYMAENSSNIFVNFNKSNSCYRQQIKY